MGSGTGLRQPPDNSFDRRADRREEHTARHSTADAFHEKPQSGYVARSPFEGSPVSGLDPALAKELGLDHDETAELPGAQVGKRRVKNPDEIDLGRGVTGAAASNAALEDLLREGRAEFNAQTWIPHRPPRPEKSEGGLRLEIKSELEPKGDQPTAIRELVDGANRHERTQVLLGVTGSGKTFTMAKVIEATQRPALVLAPNKTLAAQLYGEFKNFFPDNAVEYFVSYYDYYQPEAYVPRTDTYIEKDSSINEQIDRMRHSRDARAAGARRRHHRRLGVLHLRYRLGRNLFGDDLLAEEGRTHRTAPADRRPGRAAIQAHAGFLARHLPGARRHHRNLSGAL